MRVDDIIRRYYFLPHIAENNYSLEFLNDEDYDSLQRLQRDNMVNKIKIMKSKNDIKLNMEFCGDRGIEYINLQLPKSYYLILREKLIKSGVELTK